MERRLFLQAASLLPGLGLQIPPATSDSPPDHLRSLLVEFLAAAGRNDSAVFERFFADDLVYTRATGETTTKAEILASVRASEGKAPAGPKVTYAAEDVQVRMFREDLAVVNFRLVQMTDGARTAEFRNTATFLRRDARWQAIAWQATRRDKPASD